VACAALKVVWEDLAEVRSVAVKPSLRGRGIGRMLVEAVKKEARELLIPRVFCLTYVPGFFRRLGFREVDKGSLPHKIWADCINCPQFPDCGEVPLVCDL
jgi:amino-acid N-acetyltransferase